MSVIIQPRQQVSPNSIKSRGISPSKEGEKIENLAGPSLVGGGNLTRSDYRHFAMLKTTFRKY